MSFNPDRYKQLVEVPFSQKINPMEIAPNYFNNLAVIKKVKLIVR